MASEDSLNHLDDVEESFLLIFRTRYIFTVAPERRVARDTRVSQHIVGFCNRPSEVQPRAYGYSYRRRLPGLGFKASPES